MAKTSHTVGAAIFPGLDANGKTANVIGDVTSHVMKVATLQDTLPSLSVATIWSEVMPNACGSCHAAYRMGK